MGAIKDRILEVIHAAADTPQGVRNPDRKSNTGQVLFELFFWQEVQKEAETQTERIWEKAVEGKLVKDDDYYRNVGPGEVIAAESDTFSCLMKVGKGRATLDKEAFLLAVAKKARISVESLQELWDKHQKVGKNSLSKRVLEV